MKYFILFSLLLFCGLLKSQVTICKCDPSTDFDNQERSIAKHEKHYDKYKIKKDTINIAYIYKWEKLYSNETKSISKNPDSQRRNNTPEDTLYTLKGYLWFVKIEKNDCDFHMEIGPKKSNGVRIVVEVTQENKELQKKIKNFLNEQNLEIMGCGISDVKKAHFKKGVPVVVIGLGFYDASHKPNTNHGDKHTKKYSWELHPVKDIKFL